MNRIDRIEEALSRLENREPQEAAQKKFRIPYKVRSLMKQSDKKKNHVLVQYLTMKQEVRFMLQPIVSGNIIVVDHKVHMLNPRDIWRYGKHTWYIVREIDRKPVSNKDYNLVKKRGDDTENDVPLIKAVLGAVKKQNPLEGKKGWIIAIILIIVAAVVGFIIFGGK